MDSFRKYEVYYGKMRGWLDPDEIQYLVKIGRHEVCLVMFHFNDDEVLYLNGTAIAFDNLWRDEDSPNVARVMFDELTGHYPWQIDAMIDDMPTRRRMKHYKRVVDKTRLPRPIPFGR